MHQRLQKSETQLEVVSKLFLQLFTSWLQLSLDNHNNGNDLLNQYWSDGNTNRFKKARNHGMKYRKGASSSSNNNSKTTSNTTEDALFGTFGTIDAYRLITLLRKLEDLKDKDAQNADNDHGYMKTKRRRKYSMSPILTSYTSPPMSRNHHYLQWMIKKI